MKMSLDLQVQKVEAIIEKLEEYWNQSTVVSLYLLFLTAFATYPFFF